jgi:tetratricopeptide (TPR) repeat protein
MKKILVIISLLYIFCGCKKYLDGKPDLKLQIPNTVQSLQSMLDYENLFNLNTAATGEVSADNYYVTDAVWAALTNQASKNMYTWEDDITLQDSPNPWGRTYDAINVANVVLENIAAITPSFIEQSQWQNVKGSALLYRAKFLLSAVGIWAKQYDAAAAATDPGIPVRLNSDFNIPSVRSTVKESYERVLKDLYESIPLLPATPAHVMRPSKAGAYGLLARTYLMMRIYDSAAIYCDKCLAINSSLMNYNTINASLANPFPLFNSEVIMHFQMGTPTILSNTRARVDSILYKSYAANDLRKTLFFIDNLNGSFGFRGSYSQSANLFSGIATDEMYLVKAECLARAGNTTEALKTLNTLMITRWKTNTFVPFTAPDAQAALALILQERRKELIFRDLRWTDLKRLNKEDAFKTTIMRKLNGAGFILQPNENRYALPIPATVIQLTGMQQNPR